MQRIAYLLLLSVALMLPVLPACEDSSSNILDTKVPEIPVPTNLSAVIGTTTVVLSWDYDQGFNFNGFNVYRSEDAGASYSKIASPSAPPFTDNNVRTGVAYLYQVAGLNSSNIEGNASTALSVVVSFFAVNVNAGDEYTNSRDVQLVFSAPAATQLVRFGETADLSAVSWETYAQVKAFRLSSGEGAKTVYAEFTDQLGHVTDVFSDMITLDTQSRIESLTFTPAPPLPVGQSVRFVVTPVGLEKDGVAQINVQLYGSTIIARDDGTNGDVTAGDGVYERSLVFPQSFRGVDLLVSAIFTDPAGNQSDIADAATRLSFTDPPPAVFVLPATDSTTTSISLRWTMSDNLHFERYELYRDVTSAVARETSTRIATVYDPATLTFTDSGILEGTTYFYAVYVVNDLEEAASSNVRLAHTADVPPAAVTLSIGSIGPTQATLTWTQNNDTDFQEYRVYRSTSPGVTNSGSPAATVSNRFTTYFDDTGLSTGTTTYYYRVYVYDKGGNATRSEEVSTATSP